MDFEDNPFGLLNHGREWLVHEMNVDDNASYRPRMHSGKRLFPITQLEKARAEYWRRVKETDAENTDVPIHPVLVTIGVNKKLMKRFFEKEIKLRDRYIYFPTLTLDGKKRGAFFLTHSVGTLISSITMNIRDGMGYIWTDSKDWLRYTCYGTSYVGRMLSPNYRFNPHGKNRDRDSDSEDADPDRELYPFSRLICDVDYSNRNIIDSRRYGKVFMDTSHNYTRLFLACKIFKPADDKTFAAIVVLWEKNDENNIVVRDAISFGTRDLHPDIKRAWAIGADGGRPDNEFLPPVLELEWRRPVDAHLSPETLDSDENYDRSQWLLTIPATSLLYKVMGKFDGSLGYYTDHLHEKAYQTRDMELDLLKIALCVYEDTNGFL